MEGYDIYIYMLIYYSKIYWSVLGSILTPPLPSNATLITCDEGVGRHTRGSCWHGHTRAACWVLWVCGTNVTVKPTPARPDATLPATWTLFRNVLNTPRTTPSTEHTGRLRQPVRVCLCLCVCATEGETSLTHYCDVDPADGGNL